jgi:hypothetical protein
MVSHNYNFYLNSILNFYLKSLGYDSWKIVRKTTQDLLLVGSTLDLNENLKNM